MHKIEIPAINFVQEIPQEISEMNQDQYLVFVRLLLKLMSGAIDYTQFRIGLIIHLLDIRPARRLLGETEKEDIQARIFQLSELMDSYGYTEDVEGKPTFNLNLSFVKNPIAELHLKNMDLVGPADALMDICFQEYIDAHSYYGEYIDTKEESALNRLIAVLYRPEIPMYEILKDEEDFNGQRRIKYNDTTVNARAELIAQLPFELRYGVFLFFRGCEEFLRTGEIPLGGAMIQFKILYRSQGGSDGDDTGLVGILFTLAESQVFGTAKETAETNLYDVMVRMYQLMKSYKDTGDKPEKP